MLTASLFVLGALAVAAILVRHASLATEQGKVRPQSARKTTSSRSHPKSPSAAIQTARNLGKAYYEQGKYVEAIAEFQKVIASGQALATDHLDLGMALVQANNLDAALGEMTTAKQMDPKLTAIDYNLGILYKRELRYPDAEAALKRVVEADPHDPAAWFNLGDVYSAERKLPEALDTYQHVLNMGFARGQNFYVASLFHAFTILTRLKRPAEAQKVLKIHEQFRDKVPNLSLQNPALEGGKYGAILEPSAPLAIPTAKPEFLTLADITANLGVKLAAPPAGNSADAALAAAAHFTPSVAIGDYDGDGHPDLYVVIPSGTNHLFHNNGDGTFTDATEKAGVAGPGGSVSAAFADYDNSGHLSLFIVGAHGVTLYRNKGDGMFADETEKAGFASQRAELDTRAVLFDADDDGFLDLVVTVYAELDASKSANFPDESPALPSHFYRNNGDGTFKDLTASSGLASAKGRMRDAVFADFNSDGYADLLFLRDDGPPLLYLNQGEDKFVERTAEAGVALAQSNAVEARVADFNHDGNFDLALWSDKGYQVLLNRGNAKFEAVEHLPAVTPPASPFAFRGAVTDLDGDGFDDLVNVDASGKLHFIQNRGGHFAEHALHFASSEPALAYLAPAWLSNPGRLDLLAFNRQGGFGVFEKQGQAPHWLEFKLDGYKSNKQGIGTVVELKSGNFYKKVEVTGEPVRVFTGDLGKLDVVRVTWPNAIVQNSIDVATNKPMSVRESERLASSCPFLYVWDGKQYKFFTDILGVAPLGELLPDGSRIKPNPEDLIRLGDDLRPENGGYTFQITDEMREVDYVDQLRLVAVDHPATEEVYSNEIYSSSPAPPALYAVGEKRFPVSAIDDHGHDVLPLIRERDGRYPTGFRRNRILGLADLHRLTLDLGKFPDSAHVALYLNGWVFWTDSNASRALMSNSKLEMISPYLQVRDTRGEWVTVIPDMGLPSGTRRTMRVDLTGKFLTRDHHVRIVTNFCVYWDQIFVALDDRPVPTGLAPPERRSLSAQQGGKAAQDRVENVEAKSIELPLVSADLHYRGFSTPTSDPEHLRPDSFDYVRAITHAPWNPFLGHYTRYGAVDALVKRGDDRLVVMATGDEITVRFSARGLPKVQPGWKRDFFLYARGYAKDGEPNTAYWRTVEPLPFFTMSNYPYTPDEHSPDGGSLRDYVGEYETRPAHALIPPLAPAF
ncbi:MAG TPA: FG-GAP-like repeat-containing protein [Terriglobia bacterium]|nr:FG-GAP-like repeat-containing protein [Terriglobia bacterium]